MPRIAQAVAEVRRQVERMIESHPTVKNGLQRGIINSQTLSRYILENCVVDPTQDTVLGILRAHSIDDLRGPDNRIALKDCNISMRAGIAYLTLENTPDVMRLIGEFTGSIKPSDGEVFRVFVSSNSVRVMAKQETLDKLTLAFRSKDIISYSDDLAELCLVLPEGAERLGEITKAITAQLTLNE